MSASEAKTEQAQPRRVRRKSGSYAAADGRREAILEAAIAHFAQWGYFNSSMPKIAEDVGMSRAGLLHHFDSKEALLAAVLQLRERRAAEQFFLPLEQGTTDPIELFRGIADQAEFNETEPGLTQMFSVLAAEASNEEHPAHTYFKDRYVNVAAFMEAVLRRGRDAGSIRPEADVAQVAQEILAVSDGYAVQWALAGDSYGLAKHVRSYLDRLARAITIDGRGLL